MKEGRRNALPCFFGRPPFPETVHVRCARQRRGGVSPYGESAELGDASDRDLTVAHHALTGHCTVRAHHMCRIASYATSWRAVSQPPCQMAGKTVRPWGRDHATSLNYAASHTSEGFVVFLLRTASRVSRSHGQLQGTQDSARRSSPSPLPVSRRLPVPRYRLPRSACTNNINEPMRKLL